MSKTNKNGSFQVSIKTGNDTIKILSIPPQGDLTILCKKFCLENYLDKTCENILLEEIKKYLMFQKNIDKPELKKTKNEWNKSDLSEIQDFKDFFKTNGNKFPFKPQIDHNSNKIINNKRRNSEKSPKLFLKKENSKNNFSKPKIQKKNFGGTLYEKSMENKILKK